MNLPKSSALSQTHAQQVMPNTLRVADRLTPAEIDLLRQRKKSIADFVQKEFPERLKQWHMAHILDNPLNLPDSGAEPSAQ